MRHIATLELQGFSAPTRKAISMCVFSVAAGFPGWSRKTAHVQPKHYSWKSTYYGLGAAMVNPLKELSSVGATGCRWTRVARGARGSWAERRARERWRAQT